ncbi:MAG: hypothetical protein EA416_03140 [Trueperaceae bacterium]|nr:MAG: hypothetical protein EA416_03140 [Trueperaceae bacterium]
MIAAIGPHRRSAQTGAIPRLAALFAWLTAAGYLLLAAGWLGTGGYQSEPGSEGIVIAAAVVYALGGALMLLRRRWLWVTGATFNALVMLMFFAAYASDPSVLLSSGGLVTKAAQLALQVTLLVLIVRRR